ncbi:MAG: acyl carrier protein [Nonlabens sp.]|jgi:acyl carrier protein
MNKKEFIVELSEIMMLDDALLESTELKSLAAYDSMTHLTLLSLFEDEFGKEIETEDLLKAKTIADLIILAELS